MVKNKRIFIVNENDFIVATNKEELKKWYNKEFSGDISDSDLRELEDLKEKFLSNDEDIEHDYLTLNEAMEIGFNKQKNINKFEPFILDFIENH